MKIICTQENLKNGLLLTTKIITNNNTLPILNNILLKTENGQLKICSTNLELAINTKIRCKVEEEGQTTVHARMLMDLVNNLNNENLNIEAKDGNIEIKTENQKFNLKTLNAEEFPFTPDSKNTNQYNIKPLDFKQAMQQVVFATSANQTQPEISGVYVSFNQKQIRVVATDRYRLAERVVEGGGEGEVIIPQKTVLEVVRILNQGGENFGVVIEDNQIFFNIGDTQIISRLVDGQYPDYKSIVPENFNSIIVIQREKLQTALKTGALFSQSTSSVKMDYKTGGVRVSSESEGVGSGEAEIACKVEGGQGSLLLNYKYVLDFLSQVQSENVIIKIVNDSSPAVFAPEGDVGYMYLVMPIKI